MKHYLSLALLGLLALAACSKPQPQPAEVIPSLKDAFPDYKIGVAVSYDLTRGNDSVAASLVAQHFNSIVAENCMKCEVIHPEELRYDFDQADWFVKYGVENGMQMIGHCLIWHSQCAPWFGVDRRGKPVKPEVLRHRMKEHITTILKRYEGRVHAWDVVNEAILDDGSYRPSFFYQILGEEYIPLAFQYAYEADSTVELYLNDYAMSSPAKVQTYLRIIRDLRQRGLRIDAMGFQSHMGMDHPNWERFEAAVKAFVDEGIDVQFTEVDMSATPTIHESANISDTVAYMAQCNPYPDGLPDSVSVVWNERMTRFLSIVDRYVPHVRRVTVWGVTDAHSWKNDWPIKGRTEYPLWFDRQYQMKPFLRDRLARYGE